MKKNIFVLCYLFFSVSLFGSEPLRAGLFHIVPYAYVDKGKLTGITYDIIQSIQKEENITIETKLLPYKRMLNDLKLGKIDFGIFFVSDFSESFSEKLIPIYDLETIVIGKKNLKINNHDDLLYLHMATPLGVNYNAKLDKDKQLKITRVKDYKNAILMLKHNNIDAIIGPREIIAYQLKLLGMDINTFGKPYVLTTNTAWIQFSDKSEKKQYKTILKNSATKLLKSGKIDAIIQKYYQ